MPFGSSNSEAHCGCQPHGWQALCSIFSLWCLNLEWKQGHLKKQNLHVAFGWYKDKLRDYDKRDQRKYAGTLLACLWAFSFPSWKTFILFHRLPQISLRNRQDPKEKNAGAYQKHWERDSHPRASACLICFVGACGYKPFDSQKHCRHNDHHSTRIVEPPQCWNDCLWCSTCRHFSIALNLCYGENEAFTTGSILVRYELHCNHPS